MKTGWLDAPLTLHDLTETILIMKGSPFCSRVGSMSLLHVPTLATYTPKAILVAPLPPPAAPGNKARIYMNSSVSN